MYVNESKRLRAVKEIKERARAAGQDMTKFSPDESEVKELYLKFGGLWREKVEEEEVDEVQDQRFRRGRSRKAESGEVAE